MLSCILCETLPSPANISKNWKPLQSSPRQKLEFQPKQRTSNMSSVKRDRSNMIMCVHYFGPFIHWVSSLLLQSAPASNRQVCWIEPPKIMHMHVIESHVIHMYWAPSELVLSWAPERDWDLPWEMVWRSDYWPILLPDPRLMQIDLKIAGCCMLKFHTPISKDFQSHQDVITQMQRAGEPLRPARICQPSALLGINLRSGRGWSWDTGSTMGNICINL